MPKIDKLPSGSYRIRISIGKSPEGKYKYKSFTAKDKATLRRMVVLYENSHQEGDAPMLLDAIDDYIHAKTAVLSPYSIRGYRNIYRVLETLSCAAVACDGPASAFQTIINELVLDGKSPKTVRNYAALISSSVRFAGYPAPRVTLPQREKKELPLPDEKMMRKILAAAKGTSLDIPIRLGMLGLRRGEVCAVTADDLNRNMLHIRKAAVEIDGQISVKAPKTYDSDRWIQIPADLAARIRKAGRATDLPPSQISDRFFALLKKNGLPHYRFHDLRAFFVSYCHNVLHLSDAQVQKLGGWRTSYVMRRHYLQSMQDRNAARKVSAWAAKL